MHIVIVSPLTVSFYSVAGDVYPGASTAAKGPDPRFPYLITTLLIVTILTSLSYS